MPDAIGRRSCRLAALSLFAMVAAAGCGTKQIEVGGTDNFTTPGGGPGVVCGDGGVLADGAGAGGKTVGFMSGSTPVFDGVVTATVPPPPISGGTLLVLRDGVTAVVADPDRDRVYVVDVTDLSHNKLLSSIALNLHDEPGRLVEDGARQVHVALRGAGALATIDPVAGKVTMRRAACPAPRGIAYDAVADRLLLACAGGDLLTFAPTAATPERSLKIDSDLRDVVVDGSRVILSRFRSAETIVLDANGTVVERSQPSSYINPSVHQGASFAPAVAWRTVGMPGGGAIMIHQRGMNGTVNETAGGYGGFSPCDSIVHGSVTRIKPGERPEPGTPLLGFVLPVDVAVSSDGKRIAMVAAGNGHAQQPGGARRMFVANVDDVTKSWPDGCNQDDIHSPSPSPNCSTVATSDGTCPSGLTNCGGKCIDPVNSKCDPSIMPTAMDVASGAGAASGASADGGTGGATGTSGSAGGSVSASDGGMLAVDASARPQVCSVDLPGLVEPVAVGFTGGGLVLVQNREPAQLWMVSPGGSMVSVPLSQESRGDTGHAVFHSNSGGGLACASCHPEGHEDGRVWDFQCEHGRRTQDISGGISGTEPFHWNGDLSDFPKLMDTVFVGRMSGPQLDRDHAAAALRWINSIPSKPPMRPASDAQAQRGAALFNSPNVGCATCHAGKALTNNATVDVGTAGSFQVPSLRGVGGRAPYMHNGCAATLAARFGNAFCDGGDAHGKTSQLTPAQLSDLVAFLETL